MARLEIKGLDKLERSLRENVTLSDVKRVVRHNGSQMHQKMQANADFSKGYQTGATKRSIGLEIKDGGFTAEVAPGTEYSPYLEYGTRYMDAQPFVKPSYDAQKGKFKSDMQKLVR
jgi:HK97 gp10 family phage protein